MEKKIKQEKAITLVALVITILFSYDENIKCSDSQRFLPCNNLEIIKFSHILKMNCKE